MNSFKKVVAGGAIAATSMVGGAVGATFIGTALADTPSTTSTTDSSVTTPSDTTSSDTTSSDSTAPDTTSDTAPDTDSDGHGHGGGNGGPHQANGITETPLTGDDLAKATAAALAAVPDATVERAETDAEGAAYEVHMTKSDGSEVTVKLDSSFAVTDTLDGRG